MSEAALAVIRRMNAAFNDGRYEAMVAQFAPDADVTNHMPLPDVPGSPQGQAQLLSVVQSWGEGFKVLQCEVAEYLDLGDYVVCVSDWLFVSTGEGIETRWRGAEAWQVRDGQVVWGQMGFRDREAAVQAVQGRRGGAA